MDDGCRKQDINLRFAHAEIGDESFPSSSLPSQAVPSLRILDLEETLVHIEFIKEALQLIRQQISFDFVIDEPAEGVTRVFVGKRIIKEPWEVEMERRAKARVVTTVDLTDDWRETQSGDDFAPFWPSPTSFITLITLTVSSSHRIILQDRWLGASNQWKYDEIITPTPQAAQAPPLHSLIHFHKTRH